ncbi:putative peptidoglycan lipid II flippase [Friedmanniella endophytica]|uniref:Putative peptidoglycan lipid II flippase n=1 Tax=Microlunatus kandeliicorticis TaxID=1759536 RepID=A0A7W3P6T6_9ACTN|nr:lipid II flippase MurJ [Microlunatus kandeliicorticis]MBA8795270.1 putative peptidoglycan lipid II flippase [Microlunatus kandeliicorticis]
MSTAAGRFAAVAAGVAGLTLAARVVGFGRWLVFSKTVGDTCLGDAYNTANNLPNVLFEIVAGGILAGVVVPVVSRHLAAGRRDQAARTASALFCWTLLVLTPVGLLAVLGAGLYGRTFSQPDCVGGAGTAAALLVVFAPQVWCYGLAVVSAGLLQAQHRFWAAAAAPLASSLVVIATYLVYAAGADPAGRTDLTRLGPGSLAVLGWGTTLGVAVLAATTLVPALVLARRTGLRLRPTLRFAADDPAVIRRMAGASVAGLVVQQASVLVAMLVARHSDLEGAWTRATWANAVYLLPFAVLVSPLLQMVFPRLSAAAERGPAAVGAVLGRIGPAVATLACLGAGLLIGCAVPVARLLVVGPGSGETAALAWPIAAFAPALVGFSLMGLATRTLFAQHRSRQAGLTTVVAWGTVIVAAVVVRFAAPPAFAVTGISLSIGLGMLTGAVVGWALARPTLAGGDAGLARPLASGAPVALVVGVAGWFASAPFADAGVAGAVFGSLALGVGCLVVFAGLLWLVDRRSARAVLGLRGLRAGGGEDAAGPDEPTGAGAPASSQAERRR